MKKGNKYGTHRVIEPKGVLPQPANKIDNNMDEIYDNEILIDVQTLNVDSASFTDISNRANHDPEKIKEIMFDIVAKQGKHRNPWTGSGGMLLGTVEKIGDALIGKTDLKVGDKIATLVSLSLTPLRIDKIKEIRADVDQVDIEGKAILFESGIYAKIPTDMPEKLALSALGVTGKVIGMCHSERSTKRLQELGFCDIVFAGNANDPVAMCEKISELTDGKMADITINNVNVPDTEMTAILCTKNDGIVYFFSMATSFTKAALGAEGVGSDVTMIIGNGYTKGHAEITLQELRENEKLRKVFEELYA